MDRNQQVDSSEAYIQPKHISNKGKADQAAERKDQKKNKKERKDWTKWQLRAKVCCWDTDSISNNHQEVPAGHFFLTLWDESLLFYQSGWVTDFSTSVAQAQ